MLINFTYYTYISLNSQIALVSHILDKKTWIPNFIKIAK